MNLTDLEIRALKAFRKLPQAPALRSILEKDLAARRVEFENSAASEAFRLNVNEAKRTIQVLFEVEV